MGREGNFSIYTKDIIFLRKSMSLSQHNGGPDRCPRCGGTVCITRWQHEGSCINCGWWYYGGNGWHPPASLKQMIPLDYQDDDFPFPPILPTWINDTPIFSHLATLIDRCDTNNGCEHCISRKQCRLIWDEACRLASIKSFGIHDLRVFSTKFDRLPKNHAKAT